MSYISSLQCWDEGQCIQVRLFKWPLRSHLVQTDPFVQTLPWRYAGQLLSYCHEFRETPRRRDVCRKGALPPLQHRKQIAGGWHKWDFLEARSITWDVNKKDFQHTSLWNHYKRSTFGLLIPHILAIMSWVPLQVFATYVWSTELFLFKISIPARHFMVVPFQDQLFSTTPTAPLLLLFQAEVSCCHLGALAWWLLSTWEERKEGKYSSIQKNPEASQGIFT